MNSTPRVKGGQGLQPRATSLPAKYPSYSELSSRIDSFAIGSGWPADKIQTPEEMAEAGFFFAGMQDCTRCFHCGGGLKNWLAHDNPSVEHSRWFPDCRFIRSLKGNFFVENVQHNYPRSILGSPAGTAVDTVRSQSVRPPADYLQIVNSVKVKPCGAALAVLGFDHRLIKNAIIKVLSENGWNEDKVTSDHLAHAAIELRESGTNSSNLPAETDQPIELRESGTNSSNLPAETDQDDNHNIPEDFDVVDGPHSPTLSGEDDLARDVESITLAQENRRLRDSLKCKICLDKEISIVFLPCGHLVSCSDCFSTQRRCPVCRSNIVANIKTYIA